MKHHIKQSIQVIAILLTFFLLSSCKKFLDEKPDKKLVVPSTLRDLQAILDYSAFMSTLEPTAGEVSTDDYYLPTSTWLSSLKESERRTYTWEKDYIFETNTNDWSNAYRKVYYANTVLETIQTIERNASNQAEWDNIKGQALMIRARTFMQVVELWSPAYVPASAGADMGIPLRLSTDFTETSVRPSVQETYDRILMDLNAAVPLLPVTGIHPMRASKTATYAHLARTYLAMRNYSKAGLYADSSLRLNSNLLDYNTLSASATYPIPQFNTEILFYGSGYQIPLYRTIAKVDTTLYLSYAANDCRKTILFTTNTDGSIAFKGSYDGAGDGQFFGIANDEVFLIRAEAYARAGNTAAALTDLNTLLQKRMKTGTFIPVTATNSIDALNKILLERRKELPFRGLRWVDIKRLNKEGAGITLKRIVNNQTYILPPNDLRYALPIPEAVISISGMPQNPR